MVTGIFVLAVEIIVFYAINNRVFSRVYVSGRPQKERWIHFSVSHINHGRSSILRFEEYYSPERMMIKVYDQNPSATNRDSTISPELFREIWRELHSIGAFRYPQPDTNAYRNVWDKPLEDYISLEIWDHGDAYSMNEKVKTLTPTSTLWKVKNLLEKVAAEAFASSNAAPSNQVIQ